jgi:Zn-dependent protease with chaperone function
MRHYLWLKNESGRIVNWIGLGSGIAAAAIAGAILYVIAVARARSIGRSASKYPVHDLRVAMRQISIASAGCGAGSAWIVVYSARWHHIGIAPASGIIAAAAICAVLPASVSGRPLAAAVARARGIDVRATRSWRTATVRIISFGKSVWPVALALSVTGSLTVRAAILAVSYLALNPVITGLLAPVTARVIGPDDMPSDVQGRLSALAAQSGIGVRGRLIRGRARKRAIAMHTGWLPGLHYVLATDYLLEQMPLAETEAILAHELAHARNHDGAVRSFLTSVPEFPVALALMAFLSKREVVGWMMLAVGLAAMLGCLRLTRQLAIRQEFAADEFAAASVGPIPLAAALRRLIDLNAIRPDTSPEHERQVAHPAMSRRLERLERMTAAGAAAQPAP